MRTPSRSIEMTTSPPFESFFSILPGRLARHGGTGGSGGDGGDRRHGGAGDGRVREPSATLPIGVAERRQVLQDDGAISSSTDSTKKRFHEIETSQFAYGERAGPSRP
jgi:hypothetical protein